jgi:hypothetical protein
MRETVGADTHGMAAAMVKAADALWDTRGGHDPTHSRLDTAKQEPPSEQWEERRQPEQ